MKLSEQADWVRGELRHLKRSQPFRVAAGAITQERADQNIEAATAVLNTIIALRAIVHAGGKDK